MKMLLQQSSTGLYLASKGEWIQDPKQARVFDDWIDAYDYTIYQQLSDSFIVPYLEGLSPDMLEPRSISELSLK